VYLKAHWSTQTFGRNRASVFQHEESLQTKAVMLAMERMGRRLANFSTHIGIDHENYSECFNHGYVELVKEKYGPKTRLIPPSLKHQGRT